MSIIFEHGLTLNPVKPQQLCFHAKGDAQMQLGGLNTLPIPRLHHSLPAGDDNIILRLGNCAKLSRNCLSVRDYMRGSFKIKAATFYLQNTRVANILWGCESSLCLNQVAVANTQCHVPTTSDIFF